MFRSVSLLSKLRSRLGQQPSLKDSVRWFQIQSSSSDLLQKEWKTRLGVGRCVPLSNCQ